MDSSAREVAVTLSVGKEGANIAIVPAWVGGGAELYDGCGADG